MPVRDDPKEKMEVVGSCHDGLPVQWAGGTDEGAPPRGLMS